MFSKKVFILFCLGTPVLFAQEMQLSLKQVLKTTIERNLEVQLVRTDYHISAIEIDLAGSRYEPEVESIYKQSSADSEATNSSEGVPGQAITAKSTGLFAALRKEERWGMNWAISSDNQHEKSNSNLALGDEIYESSLYLEVTQKLLKGFSFNKEVRNYDEYIVRAGNDVARFDLEERMILIVQEAERAYWNLVLARMNLTVKKDSLALAEELFRQNKILMSAGSLPAAELINAETEIASREEDIILGEQSLVNAENRLKEIMNLPADQWGTRIVPNDALNILEEVPDLAVDLETAAAQRVEMKRAQSEIGRARLTHKFRNNELLPDLSLGTFYRTNGISVPSDSNPSSFSNAFDKVTASDFPGWEVNLNLTLKPFNKQGKANLAKADLEVRKQELSIATVGLVVTRELYSAANDLKAGVELIKARERTVKLRKGSMEAEERRFKNGLTSNFFVAERQRDLAVAETNLILAKVEFLNAIAAYNRARGTLLEKYGIRVE